MKALANAALIFACLAAGTIASVSIQLASGFRGEIGASSALLNLLSVVSRKIHAASPFEMVIDKPQTITGLSPSSRA